MVAIWKIVTPLLKPWYSTLTYKINNKSSQLNN